MNETVSQAKSKADDLKVGVMEKADDLKRRGKQTAAQQLDHVAQAAKSGKGKVQDFKRRVTMWQSPRDCHF